MSSSNKQKKTKMTIKLPTQFEIMKSIRGKPIRPGVLIRAKKGGKYNRNEEKRRIDKNNF